jgi:hypothetical protein
MGAFSQTFGEAMPKQIMYIGKKPIKKDLVNNEPDRIWRGLGDVQTVTDADALKLLAPAFADVWMDVTEVKEKERTQIITKLRERMRAEQRAITPAEDLSKALNAMSNEQLEAELRRRRKEDGRSESNPVPAARLAQNPQRGDIDGPQGERPRTTNELMEDVAGAILELDKENKAHFDSAGNPSHEEVQKVLGYEISKSELAAAVALIKGP